jgi:hypothetical protein
MAQGKWQCLACDCMRASGLRDQIRAAKVFVEIAATDATEFRCDLALNNNCQHWLSYFFPSCNSRSRCLI